MTEFEEKANKIASELGYNCFRDLIADDEETEKIMAEFSDWELRQALPVVPECVAEFITKVKKAGNNLTFAFNSKFNECPAEYWNEAIVWRLNNPDEFARAWLDGFTVEKPQLFYLKHIDMSNSNKYYDKYLFKGVNGSLLHDCYGKGKKPTKEDYKFTQQEIGSMQTGSYEQIEVTE